MNPFLWNKLNPNVGDGRDGLVNPLEIAKVVSTVLKYVSSVEGLKSFRTVSRLWRDESLEKWRAKSVLLLNAETKQALIKTFVANPVREDPQLDDPLHLRDKPFRNYRFTDNRAQVLKLPLRPDDRENRFFWENCLSRAKYLDLGDCLIRSKEEFLTGVSWVFQSCPKLKELGINPYILSMFDNRFDTSSDEELDGGDEPEVEKMRKKLNRQCLAALGFFSPKETLMVVAKKLKTLKIDTSDGWEGLKTLFGRVRMADGHLALATNMLKMMPKLKNLHLAGKGTNAILQGLSDLNVLMGGKTKLESLWAFSPEQKIYSAWDIKYYLRASRPPLKVLKLSIPWEACLSNSNELQELFQCCSGTLVELELRVQNDFGRDYKGRKRADLFPYPVINLNGIRFMNLASFTLTLDYERVRGSLIAFNFNALRFMPNLSRLVFGTSRKIDMEIARKAIQQRDIFSQIVKENCGIPQTPICLPKLKEFSFQGGSFTSEALQYFGKSMKNLETLGAVLNEGNICTVLEAWPGLKKLTILPCSSVGDASISKMKETPGLEVVDRSEDYVPATHPGWNEENSEHSSDSDDYSSSD